MRSLFRQFRLSSKLDEGTAPAQLQQLAAGQSARQFAEDLARVDERLRAAQLEPEAPDSLHASIMTAVRAQSPTQPADARQRPVEPVPGILLLGRRAGWWAAPVYAAVLVACLLAALHLMPRPAPRSPFASVEKGLTQLPGTVLSPLSGELESLQRDLEKTTQFVLASVP